MVPHSSAGSEDSQGSLSLLASRVRPPTYLSFHALTYRSWRH